MTSDKTYQDTNLFNELDPEIQTLLLEEGLDPNEIYLWRTEEYESAGKEDRLSRRLAIWQKHRIIFCMDFVNVIDKYKRVLKKLGKFDGQTFYQEYFWISRATYGRYSRIRIHWANIKDCNPTSIRHCLSLIKQQRDASLYADNVNAKNKKTEAEAMNLQELIATVNELREQNVSLQIQLDVQQKETDEQRKEVELLKEENTKLRANVGSPQQKTN